MFWLGNTIQIELEKMTKKPRTISKISAKLIRFSLILNYVKSMMPRAKMGYLRTKQMSTVDLTMLTLYYFLPSCSGVTNLETILEDYRLLLVL